MMPDYRKDNPYQVLLADSLGDCGAEVIFPRGYRRVLPLYRAVRDNRPVDVLHLHWTENYTRQGNWLSQLFRWTKLWIDVQFVRSSGTAVVWTLHNVIPHECRYPRLERFFRRPAGEPGISIARPRRTEPTCGRYGLTLPELKNYGESARQLSNSIPPGNGGNASPRPPGIAERSQDFFVFGMMRPYKGLERLLRIWQKLNPPGATLRLSGPCLDANYEAKLRTLVNDARGVSLTCEFAHGEDVSRIFAAADVAVLPFENVQTSGSVILAR